jgi:pimeloyl-ACP methyl ester carboxylesterase
MSESHPELIASGYAPVNGIEMYYEVYGPEIGVPLVLLHGGGSDIDVTFGRVLPFLAHNRRVIARDEQAHGRTSDRDTPIRFETSAEDVAALLRQLGIEKADVFGFSNGASVALLLALRHPELVRKLVFASAMTRRDGAQPWVWEAMSRASFDTMPQPLKDAFLRVVPDPVKLRTMHDKDAERMRHFEEVSDDELRTLQAPTLVIAGDRDVVTTEHAVELSHLIPDARLIVLPSGHGDYLGELIVAADSDDDYPALAARLIERFLDE